MPGLRLAGGRPGFFRGGPAGDLFLPARLLLGSGLVAQGTKLWLKRGQLGALFEDLHLLDTGVQLEQDIARLQLPSIVR